MSEATNRRTEATIGGQLFKDYVKGGQSPPMMRFNTTYREVSWPSLPTYEEYKVDKGLGGDEAHDEGKADDDGVGDSPHVGRQQLRCHYLYHKQVQFLPTAAVTVETTELLFILHVLS